MQEHKAIFEEQILKQMLVRGGIKPQNIFSNHAKTKKGKVTAV